MAVNFLTLRSAVANNMAVQTLTYSTIIGHPTASQQTVQAITTSSIMTMGHVGIGTTASVSGTVLNVVGSTMISGNTSIVGAATGTALVINNNQTGVSDAFSLMMTNKQTPPSRLMFIQKAIGTAAYNNIVQGGDHILLSYDQNSGVAGANGIVIGGWNQTAGLRIGTTSSAFNGDLTANSGLTGSEVYTNNWFRVNTSGGLYWQAYGRGIYSADSAGASYGNVSVYGTGINSWNGYDINGRYTFMANGDTVGVHDRNNSWVWYNVNTTMYINKRLIVNGQSIEDRLAALEAFMNNTAMRTDRSYYSNMWGYDIGIGSNHHLAMTDGWAPDSGNSAVAMYFRRT